MTRKGAKTHSARTKELPTADAWKLSRQKITTKLRKRKQEEILCKKPNPPFPALAPVKEARILRQDAVKIQQIVNVFRDNANSPISDSNDTVLVNASNLRKLLAKAELSVDQAIEAGAVKYLVDFLDRFDDSLLQYEAAYCLTNIAASNRTTLVVQSGAVPKLNRLLMHQCPMVRWQAAWCLTNIANDNKIYRDNILNLDGFVASIIYNLMQPTKVSFLKTFTWTASVLCQDQPIRSVEPFLEPLVTTLCRCEQVQVPAEIVTNIIKALASIANGGEIHAIAIVRTGGVPLVLRHMDRYSENDLLLAGVRCIGNIVSINKHETIESVVAAGFLRQVLSLLNNSSYTIRKETCKILSTIAAGTSAQVEAIFNQDEYSILYRLVHIAQDDHWTAQKEAIWTITGLLKNASPEHLHAMVQANALKPTCMTLEGRVIETELLMAALDGLERALQFNEDNDLDYLIIIEGYHGISSLEALQFHEKNEIYEKASGILKKFLGDYGKVTADPGEEGFQFGLATAQ